MPDEKGLFVFLRAPCSQLPGKELKAINIEKLVKGPSR